MGEITDIDVTGLIKDKNYNPLGDAHELHVKAIFMRLGFEVGSLDLSSGPCDIVVQANTGLEEPISKLLRVQVKTMTNSLNLAAGSRGGVDRSYVSSEKEYKYTEDQIDLIVGVDRNTLDLYLLPSIFLVKYGKSVSKARINVTKNNWDILINWNSDYMNNEIRPYLN